MKRYKIEVVHGLVTLHLSVNAEDEQNAIAYATNFCDNFLLADMSHVQFVSKGFDTYEK